MDNSEKSEEEYWRNYYNDYEIIGKGKDLHLNISRTRRGETVSDEVWNQTIAYMKDLLEINKQTVLLELCCGNGLVSGELAPSCKEVFGVDYSETLLGQFKKRYSSENINLICSDVNRFVIEKNKFDVILIYFSIQHFNERDSFLLIEKCINSISPKGKILIGDIPDLDKKWRYINKDEYHRDYFHRLVNLSPKIGNWFQKDFFLAMNSCYKETSFHVLEQPIYQINSDYRFDVLISKQ